MKQRNETVIDIEKIAYELIGKRHADANYKKIESLQSL